MAGHPFIRLHRTGLLHIRNEARLDFCQGDCKRGADTFLASHRDMSLVQTDNLIHHGQSDTVALGSVGGIPLIETVKYVKTHVLAHAASIVNDLEYGIAVLLMQLYLDFSPVRGEFDGIVNQVDPDLV